VADGTARGTVNDAWGEMDRDDFDERCRRTG
jgi:hypothetical protein